MLNEMLREVRCKSVATAITVKVGIPVLFVLLLKHFWVMKGAVILVCLSLSTLNFPFAFITVMKADFFIYSEVKPMPDEKNLTREYYLGELKKVAERENRLPKKSDFSDYDVMKIKGYFGPWPWALEEAGLKEPKKQNSLALSSKKSK